MTSFFHELYISIGRYTATRPYSGISPLLQMLTVTVFAPITPIRPHQSYRRDSSSTSSSLGGIALPPDYHLAVALVTPRTSYILFPIPTLSSLLPAGYNELSLILLGRTIVEVR